MYQLDEYICNMWFPIDSTAFIAQDNVDMGDGPGVTFLNTRRKIISIQFKIELSFLTDLLRTIFFFFNFSNVFQKTLAYNLKYFSKLKA